MRRFAIPTLFLIVALAAPAAAEEIIYLKSGAAMPIVSHKVDGDMIHVDLGDNAFMAFPISAVDRVEKAGTNVMLRRSTTGGTNVMQPHPDPTGSFPVQAFSRDRSKRQSAPKEDAESADGAIGVDAMGVAVYRPLAHSSQPGKRDSAVAGRIGVLRNGGRGSYNGAVRVGTRQVMKVPSQSANSRPQLTGIEVQPAVAAGRAKPPATREAGKPQKPAGKGD